MNDEPATRVDTTPPNPSARQTRAEIDEWIRGSFARSGSGAIADITEVKETPWSTVLAAAGGTTRVYFKAVWPPQRHEVSATALLASEAADHVVQVVAVDDARGWMLLGDAGEPLKRRKASVQVALLPEAVRRYAELQIAVMPRATDLLSAGVPDRRDLGSHLDRLVVGYPSEREDTLDNAELVALRELARDVSPMERHLAALVPPSVEHGDLHPGNVLVDAEDRTRIFDWGDVSVGSPFLSLAVLLASVEESLGLAPGDAAFDAIVAAYLAPFGPLDAGIEVPVVIRQARLLGSISRAVTWDYVATHVPPEDRAAFPDPVASSLRDCLRLVAP
jgi:hypothetical protein